MPVNRHSIDHIGVIVFSNPPLNPISATAGIPQGIAAALAAFEADPDIRAVVLAADGKMFSAGADIAEFNNDPASVGKAIRDLTAALDQSRLPVVAALQGGGALGGGLELALACDYRIAATGARFGLPETTLGIIPGAGGTQRLPRLIGASHAARLIANASILNTSEAMNAGLIDRIGGTDLRREAIDLAVSIADHGRRRSRDRPINDIGFADTTADLRAKPPHDGRATAVLAAIDAIEVGITQGFDAGLDHEYQVFDELLGTESARALRYAFLAERAVAHIPNLAPALKPRAIETVAIIGAGTMGIGISLAVVQAGLKAVVIDAKPDALDRARTQSHATIDRNLERGRINAAQATIQRGGLTYSNDFAALASVDLVIEAVFEDIAVKQQVFQMIDAIAAPGTILASNTSSLDLDQIAAFTKRPEDMVGLHFFSPANLMKLLEVVRGAHTADRTLVTAMAFARQIHKVGVVAGVCDGFIGNRMFEEYLRQAYFLLEEGALPAQIDGAMERWGMAMGPLRTMDLAGQDIGYDIRRRRAIEQPDRPYSRIPDLICDRGWFGQKTGRGYYLYPGAGAKPQRDPEVEAIIVAESARLGMRRRQISDAEILSRCLCALANEGAKLLDEGIAARPLDIDTVWMNGYGFPRFRGGPMFYADRQGLDTILDLMTRFATGHQGWAWAPAPLLQRLAKDGKSLGTRNIVTS